MLANFWVAFSVVPLTTALSVYSPKCAVKQHKTIAQFWEGVVAVPSATACAIRPEMRLKQHRTLANFCVGWFWPLFIPKCTF